MMSFAEFALPTLLLAAPFDANCALLMLFREFAMGTL